MKRPPPPPDVDDLLTEILASDPQRVGRLLGVTHSVATSRYLPWRELRFRTPPPGLSHREWWTGLKMARRQMYRTLPLRDANGRPFVFSLPDDVLRLLEEVAQNTGGQIGLSEQVTNPATRNSYLVSSLIEEAISSSQLEGASTTRRVAKDMIRSGRSPRDHDERMILNNYQAMQMVRELQAERLTPEIIFRIHRRVTDGTLDNPTAAGRYQLPDEERVVVHDSATAEIVHRPPAATTLPERMERLCAFANGDLDEGFVHPVLRAITLHFMIGYNHPFEDGNGRTARALFYWSMLNQNYWLTEFIAISPILKRAPARYARSYLDTEADENDLTYFHLYQLDVLRRAIKQLHDYLGRKAREVQEVRGLLSSATERFNHRQIALIERALKDPTSSFTARSHMTSHNVVYETARHDLVALERLELLVRGKTGRSYSWTPAGDLAARLRRMSRP